MIQIAKCAIICDATYLVLLRSHDSKFFPDHWDFPGGKLESAEDPNSAINRELSEEIGLIANLSRPKTDFSLSIQDVHGKNYSVHFIIYELEISELTVKLSNEHQEFRWLSREELLLLPVEPYILEYFKRT